MRAATEFHGVAEPDHAHPVAVLLAEQGDGSHGVRLFHRRVSLLLERVVRADQFVDPVLDLPEFLVGDLGEV